MAKTKEELMAKSEKIFKSKYASYTSSEKSIFIDAYVQGSQDGYSDGFTEGFKNAASRQKKTTTRAKKVQEEVKTDAE